MAVKKNTSDLLAQAASTLPDNTTQQISPQDSREMAENIAFSSFNKITDTALVGLKEYSTIPTYEAGQACLNGGSIYISNKVTGPGVFAPADWDILTTITPAQAAAITANTAKVTNATHTGEVTGSGALTVQPTLISGKTVKSTLAGTEEILINDGGVLKKVLASNIGGADTSLSDTNQTISTATLRLITVGVGGSSLGIYSSSASANKLHFRNAANSFNRASIGLDASENFSVTTLNAYFKTNVLGHLFQGLTSSSSTPLLTVSNSSNVKAIEVRSDSLVGIGNHTSAPTAQLHVKGLGSTSGTTALLVQDSLGIDLLEVKDDGTILGAFPVGNGSGTDSFQTNGVSSNATGNQSLALLRGAVASNLNSVAIGQGATASGQGALALMNNASATAQFSLALGVNSDATGSNAIAIGNSANGNFSNVVAVGAFSNVSALGGVAVGNISSVAANYGTAYGFQSNVSAAATYSVALGTSMQVTAARSIMIGCAATPRINSVAKSFQVNFDESTSTVQLAQSANSWINTSANFGIGLTAPTAKLHLKGSGSTSSTTALLVQNALDVDLFKINDLGTATLEKYLDFNNSGSLAAEFGYFSGGFMHYTAAGVPIDFRLNGVISTLDGRWHANGNLNIGTSSLDSGAKLNVQGDVRCTSGYFQIDQLPSASKTASADYLPIKDAFGTVRYLRLYD